MRYKIWQKLSQNKVNIDKKNLKITIVIIIKQKRLNCQTCWKVNEIFKAKKITKLSTKNTKVYFRNYQKF